MSTKVCTGYFSLCLDLELLAKNEKDQVSTHLQKPDFLHFIKKSRSKPNKILETILYTLLSRKRALNFSKKIFNSMVVGACQSFQFFRQIA